MKEYEPVVRGALKEKAPRVGRPEVKAAFPMIASWMTLCRALSTFLK